MGTSVACALTAETIFEIVKYISDGDWRIVRPVIAPAVYLSDTSLRRLNSA